MKEYYVAQLVCLNGWWKLMFVSDYDFKTGYSKGSTEQTTAGMYDLTTAEIIRSATTVVDMMIIPVRP